MYLWIIMSPLLSAFIAGIMGRYVGERGAGYITSGNMIITCLLAWYILWEVGVNNAPTYINIWTWIDTSGLLTVPMGLQYDSLTGVMLIVVTSISTLVHIYSTEYMKGDPHVPRFMSYLSLFTFFMLVLVSADNILQLFIGWEGVGLCSYLLINFWYTRIQANKSAIKAMIVNRVGDVAIAVAMFLIWLTFGSLEFSTIFAMGPYMADEKLIVLGQEIPALTAIGTLILVGAAGKSAQVGLHTWLPDAMEGPTPVSALIHAATMVTAGVFLIIRCSPILEYSPFALSAIAVVGAITAFMAATIGVVQNDIKKVIAYSTCSQLGYMIFACGISNYTTSLFHLMNHAFFKALLFLSAGCVIHAMADEQDMRKLGGLISSLPLTYSMMLIGSLSLMGFPFLTGFYSKDAILELAYAKYTFQGTFAHWLGTISAFLTAFYSFRLLYLTFLTDTNAPQTSFISSHESPAKMSLPLVILAFGSIFIGWLFKDMIIGPGTSFWSDNSVYIHPLNMNLFEAEFLSPFIKWIPVIFSLTGATLGFLLYHYSPSFLVNLKTTNKSIYTFFNNKWNFDFVYNSYIVKPLFAFGHDVSYKVLDRGLIEYIGPFGITKFVSLVAKIISRLQSGLIYNYAFTIFIFLTIFIYLSSSALYSTPSMDLIILLPLIFTAGFFASKDANSNI